MKQYRVERVADAITREIADILKKKVADPRLQGVTITACRVSKDIRSAHVFYSIMGTNPDLDAIQRGLESARGFLRRELGNVLDLRYTPELRFEYDQSLEKGNRIWETLETISESSHDPE